MTSFRPTRRGALHILAAGVASAALPAFAQWPDRAIRIVVTFPPGGSSDVLARVMAEQLAKKLGQPVVVDNKPGAGGTIGGAQVAAAAADGYTLMLSNTTPIALGPFTLDKQPYDPVTGFTHIAYLGAAPLVVMASKPSGLKTYAEFEATARKDGRMDFGSGGPGSIGHIHGELLRKTTGINMVHVPYRGGAPMTTDLIANTIPVGIDVITAYVPFFKSGQLVPLAVTGTQRSPLMPDVPTMVELHQPKLVLENFFGLSGPARLPPDVVARLNTACNEVLVMPEIQKKLTELGIVAKPESVAMFNGFVKEQVDVLGPTVKGAGIKL
ncbi:MULTISPECIES: tripartite tricarboxylate transporter substrate binding protein [unclassified Variovorax]|jgi:tripartite-type tricarboxylate transporter receptor subunit TctC|uniref:Bug family tripartite tricarboxylate transporter substrate binding protein n=1 Tax=unclassified Variovorax TaxID=663243 RepID=UPI0008BF6234|nr:MULTISPECIES: tripartite tricarboxylate transporter substrate binding protein [unclassified Variovorax]SEJ80491.1 Tripartite-type tricarboxylate transporter, receptor component TctC [Variovorax sp. OK202]SFC93705.1 Tripartite-type tricarboxylate transporter, receptor component TctC [Variovorax sp. OK212]